MKFRIYTGISHRARHACHPLIPLGYADRHMHMPGTQPWVSIGLLIERRPAKPAGEEHEQFFP